MEPSAEIHFALSGATGRLTLSGVLDIFEAASLHETALRALQENGMSDLTLDLSGAARLDTSAIQILCALKYGLETSGRTLAVEAMPIAIAQSLTRVGVSL